MEINITTSKKEELFDITNQVKNTINIETGACLIYCPHTTASITINEGWDHDVKDDIIRGINELVPKLDYKHAEGNSESHIKASLFGSSVLVLIEDKKLKLGQWQSIYFCEWDGPRTRKVWVMQMKN